MRMPSLPRWTPAGGDENGVVAAVGDDLLHDLGAQRLRVVTKTSWGLRAAAIGRLLSADAASPTC
jgi:hypothetical protein